MRLLPGRRRSRPAPGRPRARAGRELEGSEALGVGAGARSCGAALAILVVAVFAALSAGTGRAVRGRRGALRPPRADPAARCASATCWSRRSRAGTPSGTSASPTPATRAPDSPRTAFFPLYPLLARGVGELGGGSRGALLRRPRSRCRWRRCSVALVLLYRLDGARAGAPGRRARRCCCCARSRRRCSSARRTRRACSCCGSIGAFYAARTGHWAWAGAAARRRLRHAQRRACSWRSALVLIYLYGPRSDRPGEAPTAAAGAGSRRCGRCTRCARDAAWLLLAPLGLVAYVDLAGHRPRRPAGVLSAPGVLGPRVRRPARGGVGRRWWPPSTAPASSRRAPASPSSSSRRAATRSASRRSTSCCSASSCFARGGRGGSAAPAAVRLRRLRGGGAGAAAQLSGRARSR